jgi:hypothetical protein
VEVKHLAMNPGVKGQRINVRNQRIQKLFPETFSLSFVKPPPVRQIIKRGREDSDLHAAGLRNAAFACSQSSVCSSPAASR